MAVFSVISDLFTVLAAEDFRLVEEVQTFVEEVQTLERTLKTVEAVLDDAEKRQLKDSVVKGWLAQLKDAIYEADDLLDGLKTEILRWKIMEDVAGKTPVLKKKVIKPFLSPYGCNIKKLRQKLDVIAKESIMFGFEWTSMCASDEVVPQPKNTTLVDWVDLCGRDEVMNDLLSNLLGKGGQEERSPHVISLVGMGGLGKTAIAHMIFNSCELQEHFERKTWVWVSKPFDEINLAKAIIGNHDVDSSNITDLSKLYKRIYTLTQGKKFFLVLDDFSTEDFTKWEPFKIALKYGSSGSRILVTTRTSEVAKVMGSAYTINLNLLSWEACWSVFNKIAFLGMDSEQQQLLEDLGREISKKCKGFPLAAILLGGLMRFKKSREDWKNVLDSNLWGFEDGQSCLFAPLLLSYNDMPPILRRCFLFCAVFPKGSVILVKNLIQMWMSHNYLSAMGGMEMEILGQQYFQNLAMRSFFLDFEKDKDDGRIVSFKMHDMVHDFARQQMQDECFATVVDGKESGIGSSYESTLHVSIKFARQAQFPSSVYCAKNLRTLVTLNARHVNFSTVLPNFIKHLTSLRALSLSSCSVDKLPIEIGNLMHLRYLDLSFNYDIEVLPETMCNLCNLQSLDVSGCYILKKLPQGMGKLINLRHLMLDGTDFMKTFPKGFGRLISLRTLCKFIVGGKDESKGCKLEELKHMNNLQGTLEIKGLENVINVLEAKNAWLEKKIHLRRLCLYFDRKVEKHSKMENDLLVLDALKPHTNLEHLEISGTMMFPKWMMSLTKLKHLKLSSFWKSEPLPPLGKLSSLESLEILYADGVKKVGVEFLGIESNDLKDVGLSSVYLFPNLKSLKFQEMREWEEWGSNGGQRKEGDVIIMPHLRSLNIMYCPKLEALPEFLETTALEELRIEYCSLISNCKMLLTRFTALKMLVLKQCRSLKQLPSLGKLPFLAKLSLWCLDNVKLVGVEFLGIEFNYEIEKVLVKKTNEKEKGVTPSLTLFPELRSLEFWSFGEWEEWFGIREMGEGNVIVMPHLHSLIIYNCPKLKSVPHFLQTTPLMDFRISGCPILKKNFQRKTVDDWSLISHIPNVEIND